MTFSHLSWIGFLQLYDLHLYLRSIVWQVGQSEADYSVVWEVPGFQFIPDEEHLTCRHHNLQSTKWWQSSGDVWLAHTVATVKHWKPNLVQEIKATTLNLDQPGDWMLHVASPFPPTSCRDFITQDNTTYYVCVETLKKLIYLYRIETWEQTVMCSVDWLTWNRRQMWWSSTVSASSDLPLLPDKASPHDRPSLGPSQRMGLIITKWWLDWNPTRQKPVSC